MHTLFLEVVVALEAASEPIDGLAGLPNPKSDGVDRFPQRPHARADESRVWGFGVLRRARRERKREEEEAKVIPKPSEEVGIGVFSPGRNMEMLLGSE